MSMTIRKATRTIENVEFIVQKIIPNSRKEVSSLLPKVRGKTHKETCQKLYQYCKLNFKYEFDKPGLEEIRSPAQTIKDRKSDCEDYAIFISACLLELNHPATLRIVDYGDGFGWSHIYVVSKGIIIDPVNKTFNAEIKPKKKRDFEVSHKTPIIFNTAKAYGLGRIGVNAIEARKQGYFYESGNQYKRQPELKDIIIGKQTTVSFSFDVAVKGYYALVPAEKIQPSHLGNIENPLHFIPEAQPRNRATSESGAKTPIRIAENLRPAEISEGSTAYTGTPITNKRGEVIQGNGRGFTMRYYWENFPNDPRKYAEYLKDNLSNFGFESFVSISKTTNFITNKVEVVAYIGGGNDKRIKDLSQLKTIKNPVLVRIIDISDEEAIKLGQYKQSDLEAISTKANDIKSRINLIDDADLSRVLESAFAQSDPDETLPNIIRNTNLISQMVRLGAVRPDELEIYLRNGTINEAGVKKVSDLLINLIFKGQDTNLPDIFETLPSSLQTAIAKSTPYILRASAEKSIKPEIAQSIFAFRDYKASRMPTVQAWSNQISMFGGKPSETYSPIALALADRYDTARSQREIVALFMNYQNAVTDSPGDMFTGKIKGISKEAWAEKYLGVKSKVAAKTENRDFITVRAKALKVKRLRMEFEMNL